MTTTLSESLTRPLSAPKCRVCGATLTRTFLDLGVQPLANSYLDTPTSPDPRYPLHARICGKCLLVQADATVNPSDIFCDYPFFSSMSKPWLVHCETFAWMATERFMLDEHSTVIEVASNDGCLLERFPGRLIGIEPAKNVARAATVPTLPEFFTADLAHHLPRADLVIANNVLGHVPDLNDFVGGLSILLNRDGVLSIEIPWLLKLVEECQFDTIYHEHFSYFSLYALETVLHRHGLWVFDVEELDVHGGSLRVFASRGFRHPELSVEGCRWRERWAGLHQVSSPAYTEFAQTAHARIRKLFGWFGEMHAQGLRVVGAGAPAKGNTLLNASRTTAADLAFTTDVSPHKQGKYLPGSHVPVVAPEAMFEYRPDVVLVLAWNWFDEIVKSFDGLDAEFVHPLRLT
jgi:C-methyltransferase C-terminal domain/Putative zinc binding domain/Methyltransferase domain